MSSQTPKSSKSGTSAKPKATPAPARESRIAKVMARAGVCSRREAEDYIRQGRVKVNGKIITSPALNVSPKDKVTVDDEPLPQADKTRLWLYHKPIGQITAHKDPRGRPTVFDALPKRMGRVIAVGRLDYNSEGLLLLTNDGELADTLAHPRTGLIRHYRVRVHGTVHEKDLQKLKQGVKVRGIQYGPIEAELEKRGTTNSWLHVRLAEGKNREVRRVMASLGLQVNRLIRLQYGPFLLGKIPRGAVMEVARPQLKQKLGDVYALPS